MTAKTKLPGLAKDSFIYIAEEALAARNKAQKGLCALSGTDRTSALAEAAVFDSIIALCRSGLATRGCLMPVSAEGYFGVQRVPTNWSGGKPGRPIIRDER